MLIFNQMVNNAQGSLDLTFAALADPTRRAMLERLARGALPVTALAEPFQVSLPAISKQLRVLERAGLVTQEKDGRVRWCRLEAEPMQHAAQWIEQYRRFWDRQLESLAGYLEDAALDEGQPGPTANHQRQDPTEGD